MLAKFMAGLTAAACGAERPGSGSGPADRGWGVTGWVCPPCWAWRHRTAVLRFWRRSYRQDAMKMQAAYMNATKATSSGPFPNGAAASAR